jgi:predicted regulator of Ras-like GTPase activity (Roadblock/LC7/MglB family)
VAETQIWSEQPSLTGGAVEYCLEVLGRLRGSRSLSSTESPDMAASPPKVLPALTHVRDELFEGIGAVRALALVGLDGRVADQLVRDRMLRGETLTEFATLLRIADRASRDAGSPGLSETTWTSGDGTVLSCRVDPDRFLLLFGGPGLPVSRVRYLLRQSARHIADLAAV